MPQAAGSMLGTMLILAMNVAPDSR